MEYCLNLSCYQHRPCPTHDEAESLWDLKLTAAQREAYEREGHLQIYNVLNAAELQEWRKVLTSALRCREVEPLCG